MTSIAWKDGIIAVDTRITVDSDAGGTRMFDCQKLWRKVVMFNNKKQEVIFATAGEGPPGQLFIEKFGDDVLSMNDLRDTLVQGEADFTILMYCQDGLYEVNKWCCFEKILPTKGCYAIGSGAKALMGSMLAGKSAKQAVEIAMSIDPHTGPPVQVMRLSKPKLPRAKKLKPKPTPEVAPAPEK